MEFGPFVVEEEESGVRFDRFLANHLPDISRQRLQQAIRAGGALVDGHSQKPSYKLSEGMTITLAGVPSALPAAEPEDIALDILYEDESIAVINKPPAMVVHPSKGHWSGTLVAAAAFHFQSLSSIGGEARPGIVHRLDRDTSGVILLAKSDAAHAALSRQFQERTVEKTYWAIVVGSPSLDRNWIDQPIGPHPHIRAQMAIRKDHPSSRQAQTFYEVQERLGRYTLMLAKPKTGRTHQIRVHFASIGLPVLCDRLYGGRREVTRGDLLQENRRGREGANKEESPLLSRQALHALRISITLPSTGERRTFEAPLPAELEQTLDVLRNARRPS